MEWASPTVRFRVVSVSVEADGAVSEMSEVVEIAVAELARLWGLRDVRNFNLIDRHENEPVRRFVAVELLPRRATPRRRRQTA